VRGPTIDEPRVFVNGGSERVGEHCFFRFCDRALRHDLQARLRSIEAGFHQVHRLVPAIRTNEQ
jgi:hypothetical protein